MGLDVYRDWLKIQTPERPPDYYTLLGLNRFEDNRATIQTNYRQRSTAVRRYAVGKYSQQSQDLLDELARAMLTLTDPGRKNEYDRKLGRKTKRPPLEKRPVGQILLDEGIISASQLKSAQELVEELGIDMRQALVQRQFVSWDEATRALAQQHNLAYVDASDIHVNPELLEKVPAETATRDSLFPVLIDEGSLVVVMTHPLNLETLETLRFRAGMPVRAALASPPKIRELVAKHYAKRSSAEMDTVARPEQPVDEPASEPLSLAGWLWSNAKWLAAVLALVGIVGGYFAANVVGAIVGGGVMLALLVIALFTVK